MSTASSVPTLESAAQTLASNFAAAWNRHDAKALADFFVEDGDLINPAGRVANGKREIEALFADEHSRQFKATQMTQTVDRVRVLTPEILIATNRCAITGMRNPATDEPMPAQNAIATFVLRRDAGALRIVCARPMMPVTMQK